jgi:glycine amidinotransferase
LRAESPPKLRVPAGAKVRQPGKMDKLGLRVVPEELRDAYAFGGGLHCRTVDVYREGG